MQTFKLLFITIFSFGFLFATAQTKTESVKVLGNCGMCQGRIEKAAKAAGATSAKWDVDTDMLTVSYNGAATSLSAIETKVASIGHDTQNKTAPKEAYNKLHGCCQYERKGATTSATSCCKDGVSCCTEGGACCAISAPVSTASIKDCCADGRAGCKTGEDCCADGAVCCNSSKDCCSKDISITASDKDCCTSGTDCCVTGADCCTKTVETITASANVCCLDGADCCAGGWACCTKRSAA